MFLPPPVAPDLPLVLPELDLALALVDPQVFLDSLARRPREGAAQVPPVDVAGEEAGAVSPTVDAGKILNLAGFQRLGGRWGFHGKALLADLRIEAPAPRSGLPHLLDQPALSKDALAVIPRGARQVTVVSLDLAELFDQLAALASAIDPEARALLAEAEKAVKESAGVDLRADLLAAIGAEWTFFSGASDSDDGPPPALLVSIRDREALLRHLDTLADRFNRAFRDAEQAAGGEPLDPVLKLERLAEPERGFVLTAATALAWDGEPLEPTLLVGSSHLALALSPAEARQALSAESDREHQWQAGREVTQALDQFPERLTSLFISDCRDSWLPDGIADLPRTVQTLANLASIEFSPETSTGDFVLAGLGLPRPGGFRLRIDRALIPRASDLRSYLFPSICATAVDERGLRLIIREALPLATANLDSAVSWDNKPGLGDSKVKFTLDKWVKRKTGHRRPSSTDSSVP
jgi:hypothetical protein